MAIMFKIIINNLRHIKLAKILSLEKLERRAIYILAFAALIIINLIASSLSFRLDMSYGKAYTLSSSTKKILKNLDDLVTIKFFASSGLPTRLLPLKTEVTDLLNEYKKESKKIVIKTLDPKKDEKVTNEAKEAGVQELQFSELDKDKYALSTAYFAIVLDYVDKKEALPQIADLGSLEYNLTSSIYKLTRKESIKLGFIGQTQKINQAQDDLATLKGVLSRQFTIDEVRLNTKESGGAEIDKTIKALVIFDDNKTSFNTSEIAAIKKYLQNGGKALFFVDGVWVMDNLSTTQANHNLFSLFEEWGVNVNKNLILSTSAELVNFGDGTVSFLVPYPFWTKTNSFNSKLSYFSNINQLTFPWVSSLSLNKKEGVEGQSLVKTSKKSWEQKENYILSPNNIPQPSLTDLKEFTVAAQAKNKKGGEIVVIPSSRFVKERFLSRTSYNLELALNILNDLASSGALSGIKSRTVSFYPIPDLPDGQKDVFKYLNMFFLPLLFAAFGGIRLMKRK